LLVKPDIAYGAVHDMTEVNIGQNPVPEPATFLMFGSGMFGLAGIRWKKKI
jgi:hypothetical protein